MYMGRKFAAEFLGTLLLVFFGAGVATLVLGYRIFGSSLAAGIIAISLAFGLIYAALVYVIGPISGGHVNPAVTFGAYISRRMGLIEAVGYWVAQLAGGVVGALLLFWMMRTSPFYTKSKTGLGANGYGANSILHISGGGAFLVEVILTTFFVLVVLSLTREEASVAVSGLGIGIALALANLIGRRFRRRVGQPGPQPRARSCHRRCRALPSLGVPCRADGRSRARGRAAFPSPPHARRPDRRPQAGRRHRDGARRRERAVGRRGDDGKPGGVRFARRSQPRCRYQALPDSP